MSVMSISKLTPYYYTIYGDDKITNCIAAD